MMHPGSPTPANTIGQLSSLIRRTVIQGSYLLGCAPFVKVVVDFSYCEAIEYHLRINAHFDHDRQVQKAKHTTDLLVANEHGFYLARRIDGSSRSLYASDWDSPYSMDALRRFTLGTLWPLAPRERIWKDALTKACEKLKVHPLEPNVGADCFLGY